MSDSLTTNNLAIISGQITNNFRPFSGNSEKDLYMTDLAVKRLIGCIDYIPVTLRKKLPVHCITALNLSLLARTHTFLENSESDENSVFLDGYISRPPVFRKTPLARRITELTIAINYPYLKSDYIPCIC